MAQFPGTAVSYAEAELHKGSNLASSTANGSYTNSETTITVTDATDNTAWPADNFVCFVEETSELFFVTSRSGNDLTVSTRGFGGTAADAISDGDTIKVVMSADHFNALSDEVIALQQALTGAVQADLTIDGSLVVDDTTGSGNLTVDGTSTLTGDVTLGPATQDYILSGSGNLLSFEAQSAATDSGSIWTLADADGTDNLSLILRWFGGSQATNFEDMRLRWDQAGSRAELSTQVGGTGTVRPLHLYTGTNTDQVVLATDGNVGIGTGSPTGVLNVVGSANSTLAQFEISGGVSGSGQLVIESKADSNPGQVGIQATRKGLAQDADLLLNESGGNVGINNASPGAKLHINDVDAAIANVVNIANTQTAADGVGVRLLGTVDGVNLGGISFEYEGGTATSDAGMGFYTGAGDFSNPEMFIDGDGNVGIGTNNPGATFGGSTDVVLQVGDPTTNGAIELEAATGGDGLLVWSENGAEAYWMSYQAGSNRFRLTSTDLDGGGTNGDIFRIDDGQADVDFNGLANDNAFDYVCDSCGWSAGVWDETQPCVQCGGEMAWHDDLAFATDIVTGGIGLFETHEQKQRMKKLGLISVDEDDGTPFWKLQPMLAFVTSALSQAHRRIEALEKVAEATGSAA